MTDHRPITSKARGVCKYYTTERGCFNAKSCKFLHSTEPAIDPSGSRPPLLTPHDQAKRCKYYVQGYCKRGDKCWFIHEKGVAGAKSEDEDDSCCSICFEKPSLYGLLGGCNHIFCIDCIRKWRDPSGKGSDTSNLKKCPMCRAQCRYIIPSSRFVKDGLEKERVIQNYKESMARVPCRHFVTTKAQNTENPLCPFGADCFYQHLNDDGTAYVFPYGAEFAMRDWTLRNRSHTRNPFSIPDGLETIFGNETGLAGNFVMEMLGMLRQVMGSSVEEDVAYAGRGSEGTRLRRRVSGTGSGHVRMDFLSAMYAARAEISGSGNDEDNIPPFISRDAIFPPNSDLHSDRDSGGDGLGSNEFIAEDEDINLTEHLESTSDTESSVPPLEPVNISRQETSLLPIHAAGAFQDDDEIPELQSVSNSSDSEDNEDGRDGEKPDLHFKHDPPDDVPPLERVIQPDEEVSLSFSRRFSTVVERGRDRSEGCETMDEQSGESHGSSAFPSAARDFEGFETSSVAKDVHTSEPTESAVSPPPQSGLASEPAFVTDGRGRVVWSNKDPTETIVSSETREETQEDAQSPSSAARFFEWMTVRMSLPSTSKIKASLTEQLGVNAPQYFAVIKAFVTGQISRTEFEDAVRQYLAVPSLVQLHNALIISLFDCTIHRHPPPPIPTPAPAHKQPPFKRRRTDDHNHALRSVRLKRWTLGTGKRERERIRALETIEPLSPRLQTDEISSERGVVLLPERGDPPGSRLPVHLFSISRAPTLAHISDRMNLISAQNNLNAPARNVPSLMNLACEAKLKQLITHALTLTSASHAISSISPSTSSNHMHRPPAVLSTSAFQTLLTIAPTDLPNKSATAMRLALGETDVVDDSYDDIALLKDREVRDQRWQIVALLAERSAIRDGLRGVAKGVA